MTWIAAVKDHDSIIYALYGPFNSEAEIEEWKDVAAQRDVEAFELNAPDA